MDIISGIKRFGSIKSRKVSSQSLQSDKVMVGDEDHDDIESVLSDENEQTDVPETDDFSMCRNMPWVRVSYKYEVISQSVTNFYVLCKKVST